MSTSDKEMLLALGCALGSLALIIAVPLGIFAGIVFTIAVALRWLIH